MPRNDRSQQEALGDLPGAVSYSNPPTIIEANPNLDYSSIPPARHPPTLGPMRPPLRLETSLVNPRKKEPRPFALHFPNVMGDISEKEFERVLKEILWQFWVNEKDAVRRLPGIGSFALVPAPKTTKKGKPKKNQYAEPAYNGPPLLSEQDFKNHNDLPLARIKRIMKSDEDVRMISAEAPIVFAKACELFILELSLRGYCYSEQVKRRQFTKEDVLQAIRKTDIFDFLAGVML
ncbi:hypothetical protein TrCOL_g9929 [Triparma columacea]|uniref:Transcription factor CBF/NF-Y/archaeal histone domain-containing protein n=1 Tax=Triparma columacea TaxID=722753 RepID=A0A9W7L4Z0_9STRA|nr:hypothetical protein TrCOL_g9929 [Triparma columacea]